MSATLVGQKLGKYEITGLVGRGGMATVYKGYQREIDRSVAIKVLPPHPGQDAQFVDRFRLEARTIARLQHPHILPIYDYGDENDILFLVTALIEGGSLNDRIKDGPMPLERVIEYVAQIAPALDYAHRQGIIHRDIKPDNVLLDREDNVLIADFGIAKIVQGSDNLTMTGSLVGTPAYMSPEQGQGLPIDPRADLYSLGVMAFEMLSGKQPYTGDTPLQIVFMHFSSPPPRLSEMIDGLPDGIDAIFTRALAKDPAARYPTANAFLGDLRRIARGESPADTMTLNAMKDVGRTTTTTERAAVMAPTTPSGISVPPPTNLSTIITAPPPNPLVLLGGFAIIAIMVAVLVVVLLNALRTPANPVIVQPLNPSTRIAVQANNPNGLLPILALEGVDVFGVAGFTSQQAVGNRLNVALNGIAAPAADRTYVAWMSSSADPEIVRRLDEVQVDALGNGLVNYIDPDGSNLATMYNWVFVTDETDAASDAPAGTRLYTGSVPIELTDTLYEMFTSSPDGIPPANSGTPRPTANPLYGPEPTRVGELPGSLLDGAITEATIAQRHAGLAANAQNLGELRLHAEHTINILLGTRDDYDGNGDGANPGRGFGLPHFLTSVNALLDIVATAPSATPYLQTRLGAVRTCIANVEGWAAELIGLEEQSFTAADLAGVSQQQVRSTELATLILEGEDLNRNGAVEAFEGECGLEQIETFALESAAMAIVQDTPSPEATAAS